MAVELVGSTTIDDGQFSFAGWEGMLVLTDFPHLILDFFSATFATRLTKFARFRDSHRLAPACGRYADDG